MWLWPNLIAELIFNFGQTVQFNPTGGQLNCFLSKTHVYSPTLNYSLKNLSVALLRRKFRGQGHVWLKTFQTATGGSRCRCLLQPSNELFILIWITLPLIECDLVYYYSYAAMTRTKSTEADYYCYDDGPPTWWVYVCDCLNLLCVFVLVLYITPYICHSGLFPVTMWLPQFPCG